MTEAVRMVVWDLDNTFWKGTLTEGGIDEYLQENHDIVIELARRGILSSICSKNDEKVVFDILREKGIRDYFVFPSISWKPKGERLVALIDAVQLRPETVMFIDDNPSNRAEAAAILPGLQVLDENFVHNILTDWRFKGKEDSELSRLAQYKLLETRHLDEAKALGGNEEFLRGSNIRVYIEYDVEKHIDRAMELINRTNQLNFTKKRLPEDAEQARKILLEEIRHYSRQSGLIRVVDKYGDYGFVGFFLGMTELFRQEEAVCLYLFHFCFSCRTLGMYIEQWVYEYLGRPKMEFVGAVLTDLNAPRKIDWVKLVATLDDEVSTDVKLVPEIRLAGGCEANSLGVYMKPHADQVRVFGNYAAGSVFVRVNSVTQILSLASRSGGKFASEAEAMQIPLKLAANDFFADAPYGTEFVLNNSLDALRWHPRYFHREHGWELVLEPHAVWDVDFVKDSDKEILKKIQRGAVNESQVPHLLRLAGHMRENYVRGQRSEDAIYFGQVRELLERIPEGSKLVLLVDDCRTRRADGSLGDVPQLVTHLQNMKTLAAPYPHVAVLSFLGSIQSEAEIQVGGNHYDRVVYLRVAQAIRDLLDTMPAKSSRKA